jgi:hypothetical protein
MEMTGKKLKADLEKSIKAKEPKVFQNIFILFFYFRPHKECWRQTSLGTSSTFKNINV